MVIPDKEKGLTESTPLVANVDKHHEKAHSRRFLIICVLLFLLVAGGVWCVKVIEGWQVITSLYVVVQIVTTIGYGDFTVDSDIMKLFCAFYVLLIWVFGAYAFNHAFSWVQTRSIKMTRRKLQVLAHKSEKMLSRSNMESPPSTARSIDKDDSENYNVDEDMGTDYSEFFAATLLAVCAMAFGTIFFATVEACTCSYGKSHVADCKDDTYDECVATGGYTKNWITSFYMSVITLTTVGFGDHSPRSLTGRCVGILWMLVGVGFMARWFSTLAKLFFDYEHKERLKVTHQISADLFKAIDKDKSGSLSREEFLQYFLLRNGLITHADIDEINEHFNRLDVKGEDCVTYEMVKGQI